MRLETWYSSALAITKSYFVYEPPAFVQRQEPHLLYLFRGHEREWVNMHEDHSRQTSTAIEDIDRLIQSGFLPPLVAIMPGLNSTDNSVPSLGIDMVGKLRRKKGLGTGRYWSYLTEELIPMMDQRYRQRGKSLRLMAGFSLGGFTVSLLATKLAGYFRHAAIYDGLFMWPQHRDPRIGKQSANDKIWCNSFLFDSAFGKPRNLEAMHEWNPTDMLRRADESKLQLIRRTKFWVASAPQDGMFGNRDRARYYVSLLKRKKVRRGFRRIIHHPHAQHNWHWTDRFLIKFLLEIFS